MTTPDHDNVHKQGGREVILLCHSIWKGILPLDKTAYVELRMIDHKDMQW